MEAKLDKSINGITPAGGKGLGHPKTVIKQIPSFFNFKRQNLLFKFTSSTKRSMKSTIKSTKSTPKSQKNSKPRSSRASCCLKVFRVSDDKVNSLKNSILNTANCIKNTATRTASSITCGARSCLNLFKPKPKQNNSCSISKLKSGSDDLIDHMKDNIEDAPKIQQKIKEEDKNMKDEDEDLQIYNIVKEIISCEKLEQEEMKTKRLLQEAHKQRSARRLHQIVEELQEIFLFLSDEETHILMNNYKLQRIMAMSFDKGSFGDIRKCQFIKDEKLYAMKRVDIQERIERLKLESPFLIPEFGRSVKNEEESHRLIDTKKCQNIVSTKFVHSFGTNYMEDQDSKYCSLIIVTELCHGSVLQMTEQQDLLLNDIFELSKQMINAFEYLFYEMKTNNGTRMSIAHFDIKLDNILYCTTNNSITYKLTDFGCAKIINIEHPMKHCMWTGGYSMKCVPEIKYHFENLNKDFDQLQSLNEVDSDALELYYQKCVNFFEWVDVYCLGKCLMNIFFNRRINLYSKGIETYEREQQNKVNKYCARQKRMENKWIKFKENFNKNQNDNCVFQLENCIHQCDEACDIFKSNENKENIEKFIHLIDLMVVHSEHKNNIHEVRKFIFEDALTDENQQNGFGYNQDRNSFCFMELDFLIRNL